MATNVRVCSERTTAGANAPNASDERDEPPGSTSERGSEVTSARSVGASSELDAPRGRRARARRAGTPAARARGGGDAEGVFAEARREARARAAGGDAPGGRATAIPASISLSSARRDERVAGIDRPERAGKRAGAGSGGDTTPEEGRIYRQDE